MERTRNVFYGWWIVLATHLICLVGFGTWLYSFGVFFKPMMSEFGWTRAMTAGAYSFRAIQGGLEAPIVGWASDRYGPRIVITVGAIIAGAGFIAMYWVRSLLSFYLIYGFLLSMGMGAMLYLPATTAIVNWFIRKRARAISILSVGAGIGGFVCAPYSSWLISQVGWRLAFVVLGVMVWVVAIPLAQVVRHKPEEKGLRPDGDPPTGTTTDSAPEEQDDVSVDWTLRQAMSSRTFWIIVLAFFFAALGSGAVTVHLIPHLTDVGIPAGTAAAALGFMTLLSIIGRLGFGWLGDFVDKRFLFMVAYAMRGIGLVILAQVRSLDLAYLFVLIYGIGLGATVPLGSAIRAEYFGRRAYGKIHGFMSPFTMMASVVGPVGVGYVFDVTGSYSRVFTAMAGVLILAIIAIYFAKPAKLPTVGTLVQEP